MLTLEGLPAMPLIGCLVRNDIAQLTEIEGDLSVATAMESTTIQKLGRLIDKKNIVKAVSYLTLRLAKNFNMKGNFTPDQAATLANDLFDVMEYETLEDVVLMYKLARQGRIGDGRDFKLDGQTVLHKWVPAYLELKAIERENQHNRRKDSSKSSAPIHKDVFKDVGKEPVRYKSDNSPGRHKNAMVVVIKRKTDQELKDYLINHDSKSKLYNEAVYKLVEEELDFRNSQNKSA